MKSSDLCWFCQVFVFCMRCLFLRNESGLIRLFIIYTTGFEEDILIVSEGKMAPFTHDFRKAQQRMPAIPVNIHSMNFTWQAVGQVSSDKREREKSLWYFFSLVVCSGSNGVWCSNIYGSIQVLVWLPKQKRDQCQCIWSCQINGRI